MILISLDWVDATRLHARRDHCSSGFSHLNPRTELTDFLPEVERDGYPGRLDPFRTTSSLPGRRTAFPEVSPKTKSCCYPAPTGPLSPNHCSLLTLRDDEHRIAHCCAWRASRPVRHMW